MADDLTNPGAPDRSKVAMHDENEVYYWTKHFGVSRDELRKTVDRVGSSAAAVRKELGKP